MQGLFGATVEVDCTPRSGSSFVIGDTTVTCTATDIDTNTATATFVVRVRDNGMNDGAPADMDIGIKHHVGMER